MALEFSICEVRWERYRRVSENPQAREWLKFQATRGLAANTIEAYGRDLDSYLGFLESENIPFDSVVRPTVGAYVRSIAELAVPRVRKRGAEMRNLFTASTAIIRISARPLDRPASLAAPVPTTRQARHSSAARRPINR
jgi:integrase family protein with SAM-like domain